MQREREREETVKKIKDRRKKTNETLGRFSLPHSQRVGFFCIIFLNDTPQKKDTQPKNLKSLEVSREPISFVWTSRMTCRKAHDMDAAITSGVSSPVTKRVRSAEEMLPAELWYQVMRHVGCSESATDAVAGTCRSFKDIREDPYACTCDYSQLVRRVLLQGDRQALVHLVRAHGPNLRQNLLGEMLLSVGDLTCPPLGCSATFGDSQDAVVMLEQACVEGHGTLIRALMVAGVAPTRDIVLKACHRLDEYDDDTSLKALLECGSIVETGDSDENCILAEVSTAEDSLESDDDDSMETPSMALSRILSGAHLPSAMQSARYTQSFVYLLSSDPRFSKTRSNFCAALAACIDPRKCDRVSARHLFQRCGMRVEWLQREHVALMAQHDWPDLLDLALATFPRFATESAERAVIAGNKSSISVALKHLQGQHAEVAVNLARICAVNGNDEVMSVVMRHMVHHMATPSAALTHCTRSSWKLSMREIICRAGDRCRDVLLPNTTMYIKWAVREGDTEVLVALVRLHAQGVCAMTVDDTVLVSRYMRTLPNGMRGELLHAMNSIPDAFDQLATHI